MKDDLYARLEPQIEQNPSLREPQRLAFKAISEHNFALEREVGVVLPVGCGKSGLIALAPFALKARRALIVAPNLHIAGQLLRDMTPSEPDYFYVKRHVLAEAPFPEPADIRGGKTNLSDLSEADVVVTNIQQLQRESNVWLSRLPDEFFDLILFDEAHHNVAESWEVLRQKFPAARVVNVSATPTRADGQTMSGSIIYSYPIVEAVKNGFIKRITGHRLNPRTLTFVRVEGGREEVVSLDEVRELGETDAAFRRSIVSSEETLTTIVDASLRKLHELRETTGERRLKIIASALNMEHCKQIVAKYSERGVRADFVHSKLDGRANESVHRKLDNHELDVIVQVRKLGEGFDHPYLAVAAVFSIFSNLGPFVQFVGRIMRTIPGYEPADAVNDGVVVFHVGSNITGVWNDFTAFAEADQEYFANLVDEELLEPYSAGDGSQRDTNAAQTPTVTAQTGIGLEDVALIPDDSEIERAMQVLRNAGVETGPQFESELARITPTKQASRQAARKQLDEQVKVRVGRVLSKYGLSHGGRSLDPRHVRTDFEVLKSAIDRKVNVSAPSGETSRSGMELADLRHLLAHLEELVLEVETERGLG